MKDHENRDRFPRKRTRPFIFSIVYFVFISRDIRIDKYKREEVKKIHRLRYTAFHSREIEISNDKRYNEIMAGEQDVNTPRSSRVSSSEHDTIGRVHETRPRDQEGEEKEREGNWRP